MMIGHGETPVHSSTNRKEALVALALWDSVLHSIFYRVPREVPS